MEPLCIYCNSNTATTRDHVLPRSFFPAPRPNNLLTVPSCLTCNKSFAKDEDYFLATFMFTDAGISKQGKALWAQRLRRMYEKNIGLRRKIGETMKFRMLSTPAGIFLGNRLTLGYDPDRLNITINKIIKGLFFIEQGFSLPVDIEYHCQFLTEPKHFEAVKQHNHLLQPGAWEWEGIFQYRRGFVPNNVTGSMWLLWFWKTHIFWVITTNNNVDAEED